MAVGGDAAAEGNGVVVGNKWEKKVRNMEWESSEMGV